MLLPLCAAQRRALPCARPSPACRGLSGRVFLRPPRLALSSSPSFLLLSLSLRPCPLPCSAPSLCLCPFPPFSPSISLSHPPSPHPPHNPLPLPASPSSSPSPGLLLPSVSSLLPLSLFFLLSLWVSLASSTPLLSSFSPSPQLGARSGAGGGVGWFAQGPRAGVATCWGGGEARRGGGGRGSGEWGSPGTGPRTLLASRFPPSRPPDLRQGRGARG